MRMSRIFGRRHRDTAAGVTTRSHDLLVRAGWIRQHASGIYSLLAPGLRALRRVEAIVREEMDATGAQEVLLPVVHAADVWKATGRFATVDDTLVRFEDRRGHAMVLAMTHEEIVAQLAATEIASWRETDVVIYQIQTKFRDELRPRAGLLRTREFIMKDAYSLHVEREGLETSYREQAEAYARIFRRIGLDDTRRVRSASGDMGGDVAHEFMTPLEAGDDVIATCVSCGRGSNVEVVGEADVCDVCGGRLERCRVVEVGNIFQLGTRYTDALGAYAVDASGARRPLLMASYGIGISRLLAVLVERHHDERGIALPAIVNAFDAHIVPLDGARDAGGAERIHAALRDAGLAVLLDDRDMRAGEKFADADLMGATVRVLVGGRCAERGTVELRVRRTGRIEEVAPGDVVTATRRIARAS